MRAGTIAENEHGVVGVVTGRDLYDDVEEYDHYEKKADGKHYFIEKRSRPVVKRRNYIGVDLKGNPWKAEVITPLTAERRALLGT